jgi:hypothetical protein
MGGDSVVALVVVWVLVCWFVASLLGPVGNRPAAAGDVKMTMTTRSDVRTVPGIQVDRVEDIEWEKKILLV